MISVNRFTPSAQEIAKRAAEVMQRYGHHQIDVEHMLLALLEQEQDGIAPLLETLNVDSHALTAELDRLLRTGLPGEVFELAPGKFSITPRVAHLLQSADEQATQRNGELISPEHLFLQMFNEQDTPSARLLEGAGLTRDRVANAIRQMRG